MAKSKSELPKKIYVRRVVDGGSSWLEASESVVGWDDGDKVGIYELSDVKLMVIEHNLRDA